MKLRSHIIKEKYKDVINAMYAEGSPMEGTFLHKDTTC
jgi:hypothetical protein